MIRLLSGFAALLTTATAVWAASTTSDAEQGRDVRTGVAAVGSLDIAAHTCACAEVLGYIADYVERNYAGFLDKASGADRRRHDDLLSGLRPRAAAAASDDECYELLVEYTAFFRDPHMGVTRAAAGSSTSLVQPDAIRARFADWPARPISEAEVIAHLNQAAADLNPIEGIWEIPGADIGRRSVDWLIHTHHHADHTLAMASSAASHTASSRTCRPTSTCAVRRVERARL